MKTKFLLGAVMCVLVMFVILKYDIVTIERSDENISGIAFNFKKLQDISSATVKSLVAEIKTNTGTVNLPGPLKKFVGGQQKETFLTTAGIIAATNNARANMYLPPLTENSTLASSAAVKVADMFAKQYFEHISPSGVGVSDLAEDAEYQYVVVGENLALGDFENDQTLVDAWMASPGHRANILNTRYSEIGVAVVKGTYEDAEVWLAVQHFGLPLSACPTVDQALKNKITFDMEILTELEAELVVIKKQIDAEIGDMDAAISTYNNLVKEYNVLVGEVKEEISIYNSQIVSLNDCIDG